MGLKYNSPTIDCWIGKNDFYDFCNNLKQYCAIELIQDKDKEKELNVTYPIGVLKGKDGLNDVHIHFSHSQDFSSAKQKWDRRKERINYDNIFVVYDTHMYCQDIDCYNFTTIKIK